jgi:hypothetical protein
VLLQARQIERKLIRRDELLASVLKYMGATRCGFVFKIAIFESENMIFPELGPDTESTRLCGEPDTVTASKQ